jgi:hypothetical protein
MDNLYDIKFQLNGGFCKIRIRYYVIHDEVIHIRICLIHISCLVNIFKLSRSSKKRIKII